MAEINEKEIIDLGSIQVPEKWQDVTLLQFENIQRYYADTDKKFNVFDVIDIFINKDKDYVMTLPAEFIEIILHKLSFLYEDLDEKKPTNKITIDGEEYIVNVQNKLKAGEFIAADTLLKSDKYNLAALLAILCRKRGEEYDSKFENEMVEERMKLFEQQPVTNVFPIVNFFLQCGIISSLPTLLSMKIEEEINLTANSIETLQKNGEISKSYMKWLKKRLAKLKKSIKYI